MTYLFYRATIVLVVPAGFGPVVIEFIESDIYPRNA